MIPKGSRDLINEFRLSRRNLDVEVKEEPKKKKPTHIPPKSQRNEVSPYSKFLSKYNALEGNIESFKTRDFVYYFRQVAEESGYRYTISNIKKDMAIFKRLNENYTPVEICGMIEFLYVSEQDYLDKERLSPNILASGWVNTIYADMKLWVDDKYVPKSKKVKKRYDESKEWNYKETDTSNISTCITWD